MASARTAHWRMAGIACMLLLVLYELLASPFPSDPRQGLSYQVPLTLAGDAGIALGILCLAAFSRRLPKLLASPRARMGLPLLVTCGICGSQMLRLGILFHAAPYDLVLGSTLEAFFLTLAACAWWSLSWREPLDAALDTLAKSLLLASVGFVVLTLLPVGVTWLVVALLVPIGMDACLDMALAEIGEPGATSGQVHEHEHGYAQGHGYELGQGHGEGQDPRSPEPSEEKPPALLVASIALALFVADLVMDLFPVSLFPEASPLFALLTGDPETYVLSQLSQPALVCAVLLCVFAALLLWMARHDRVSLPTLCFVGFLAVAVGYVTFPYHSPGGVPVGIAEAGRVATVVFAITVLHMHFQQHAASTSWPPLGGLLRILGPAALAMLVADALVVAMYLQPAFDPSDFHVRSAFSGVGIILLVTLLLGPLPRVYALLGVDGRTRTGESSPAAQTGASTQGSVGRLAKAYRLSQRETDVLALLAMGRDVPYIEHELALSKSTVKTHVRHIYDKCGVSSKQELIDLLMAEG